MTDTSTHVIEQITFTDHLPPRSWRPEDPRRRDLSGTWAFKHSERPLDAPAGAAARDLDDSDWQQIAVPSHWVLLEGSPSRPIYTNVQYPIPLQPPHVPDANPTGDYRTWFEASLPTQGQRVLLRCEGIESVATLTLNEQRVGAFAGSRLPMEFDVTDLVAEGRNLLHVRVHQWSAQTYAEDQDQWWLPGIFREVSLITRPQHGIEDYWLHADYDHANGEGMLHAELRAEAAAFPITVSVPDLGVEHTWLHPDEVGPLPVGQVVPWSADRPQLYRATVTNAVETITTRLGFRRVDIVGDQWRVNGTKLRLRGVNRHEFHPDHGRVFVPEDARAGLLLMKQHNINAIRTSHYPPHPALLEMCDELGFWVIDECDLETHGFESVGWRSNPSEDPCWRANLLDRMQRMVERDKNHPSIICWSLGNESGSGANLAAMAAWCRQRDPARPVHYEGDHHGDYTDVVSRMYASLIELEQMSQGLGTAGTARPGQARRLADRPMMLCEYAHAMGNGPGALAEYEDLLGTLTQWHGGFIWEWRDHGLRQHTPEGTEYFAYGGDFGEVVHDGSFVCDGLLLADGTPTPALRDAAAVFSPVRFRVEGHELVVTNLHHSLDTSHLDITWLVEQAGELVGQGRVELAPVPAGGQARCPLPPEALTDQGEDSFLTVTAALAGPTDWGQQGHVVGRHQHRLDAPRPVVGPELTSSANPAAEPVVSGGQVQVAIARLDARDGRLVALDGESGRLPVDAAGVELWRAPTENDSLPGGSFELAAPEDTGGRGVPGPASSQRWRSQGLDRLTCRTVSAGVEANAYRVVQRLMGAQLQSGAEADLRWAEEGAAVLLTLRVNPLGADPATSWPRVGLHLALPAGLSEVEWFGSGPDEKYPDTGNGNVIGRFALPIDEFTTQYAVPQESGHRPDLRWVRLSGQGLPTLVIERVQGSVGLTVSRHDAYELTRARHPHELPAPAATHLYLDAAQHGIGSRSCGPDVLPQHQLWPRSMGFTVRLSLG